MKIGYFCNITNWEKKPYLEILDNARDIATYCDKNNWNSIWFTEHHFNHEGMESQPNPLMMCTDIAARTKQIRLGQACNVITFLKFFSRFSYSLSLKGNGTLCPFVN